MKSFYSGKTIWVTGASSGIGEHITYALSRLGARLIISSRRRDVLETVKQKCANPELVEIVTFDQGVESEVKKAVEEALSNNKKIDILFNNGGISQRGETMLTTSELTRKIFDINFFGNILLSRLVATSMIANGGGHLVITSSLLGKWGFHLRSSYAATKHALHGYYDSMRMETEQKGLAITIVMPGLIATEISRHAFNEKGEPTGEMDNNQAGGISPELCAQKILEGVASGKKEFGVGGKEILGLKVRRFFPNLFEKILRKRNAK